MGYELWTKKIDRFTDRQTQKGLAVFFYLLPVWGVGG